MSVTEKLILQINAFVLIPYQKCHGLFTAIGNKRTGTNYFVGSAGPPLSVLPASGGSKPS